MSMLLLLLLQQLVVQGPAIRRKIDRIDQGWAAGVGKNVTKISGSNGIQCCVIYLRRLMF